MKDKKSRGGERRLIFSRIFCMILLGLFLVLIPTASALELCLYDSDCDQKAEYCSGATRYYGDCSWGMCSYFSSENCNNYDVSPYCDGSTRYSKDGTCKVVSSNADCYITTYSASCTYGCSNGACRTGANGESCSSNSQCSSGTCADYSQKCESCANECNWCGCSGSTACGQFDSDGCSDKKTCTYGCSGGACVVKKANGESCSSNSECSSDHCVYGTCRASSTYCGDNHCDSGESGSCDSDCCTVDNCRQMTATCCQRQEVCNIDGKCNLNCFSAQRILAGDFDCGRKCVNGNVWAYDPWSPGTTMQIQTCSNGCSDGACLKANSESCSSDPQCSSGNCVHDVCRPTNPYCGDKFCDSESASCASDCTYFDITSMSANKATAKPGDTVTFTVNFKNTGGTSGTAYLGGAVFYPNGSYCNQEFKSATLNVGSTASSSFSWTVPSNAQSGSYKFMTSSWSSCWSGCEGSPCYKDGCCSTRQDTAEGASFSILKSNGESCSSNSECSSGTCGDISKKCASCSNECTFSGCSSDETYSCDGLIDPDLDGCTDKQPCSFGCGNGKCLTTPYLDLISLSSDKSYAKPGDTITFTIGYRNKGAGGKGYVGGAAFYPAGNYCNTEAKSVDVLPGSIGSVSFSWKVPSGTAAGRYGFASASWDFCNSQLCANGGCYKDGCCSKEQDRIDNSSLFRVNIACFSDSECPADIYVGSNYCYGASNSIYGDIYKIYRDYKCINPGTASSSCSYTDIQQIQQDCSQTQICQNGACISNNIPFSTSLEDADINTRVYKQPGDIVSVVVKTTGDQELDLRYPSNFNFISGDYYNGKLSAKAGKENIVSFEIPENTPAGDYYFYIKDHVEKVEVIKNPKLLIITDRKALLQRYNQDLKVYDALKETYKQADQQRGIVYSLDSYLTGRPWSSFDGYSETYLTPSSSVNNYAFDVSGFIKEKCENCNIMIVGDDFVVPHFRRNVTSFAYRALLFNKNDEIKQIYTDIPYTPVTSPVFSDLDFYAFFQNDKVKIIIPDSFSKDNAQVKNLKQVIYDTYGFRHIPKNGDYCSNDVNGNLHVTCIYVPLPFEYPCANYNGCDYGNDDLKSPDNIEVYHSSEISCDSFTKLEKSTVIILGDSKINRATACYPWVENSEYSFISLDKNVWDGRKGAIIVNADSGSLETGTVFLSNIINSVEWRGRLHESTGAIIAELAINAIPFKSCFDAMGFGEQTVEYGEVDYENIFWCSFDMITLIPAAKLGKEFIVAGKAADESSDAVKVAKAVKELDNTASSLGKTAEVGNLMSKYPRGIAALIVKSGQYGNTVGSARFQKFLAQNADDIARLSTEEFDDFYRGASRFFEVKGQTVSIISVSWDDLSFFMDLGRAESVTQTGVTYVREAKVLPVEEFERRFGKGVLGLYDKATKIVYLRENMPSTLVKGTIFHEYTHPVIIRDFGDIEKIAYDWKFEVKYANQYDELITELKAEKLFGQPYNDYIVFDLDEVSLSTLAGKPKSEIVKMKVLAQKFGDGTNAEGVIDDFVKTWDASSQDRFSDAVAFFSSNSNVETMSRSAFESNVISAAEKIRLLEG